MQSLILRLIVALVTARYTSNTLPCVAPTNRIIKNSVLAAQALSESITVVRLVGDFKPVQRESSDRKWRQFADLRTGLNTWPDSTSALASTLGFGGLLWGIMRIGCRGLQKTSEEVALIIVLVAGTLELNLRFSPHVVNLLPADWPSYRLIELVRNIMPAGLGFAIYLFAQPDDNFETRTKEAIEGSHTLHERLVTLRNFSFLFGLGAIFTPKGEPLRIVPRGHLTEPEEHEDTLIYHNKESLEWQRENQRALNER